MNELFREHLEAPRGRPKYKTIELRITPRAGSFRKSLLRAGPTADHHLRAHVLPHPLAAGKSRAVRIEAMKAQDPARFTQAMFMAKFTTYTVEEAWDHLGKVFEAYLPGGAGPTVTPAPDTAQGKRQAALAAKAERGRGPGAGASWRTRSRNIKYQTK